MKAGLPCARAATHADFKAGGEMINQQNLYTVFAEMQKWKMTAIAVAASGEIVSAIGYNGTLNELPRAEDIWTLHPNTTIRHLSRGQVRSVAELGEIVREIVAAAEKQPE
jgi:hypothetical protein